ncbi:PT domain-containing protein [Paenibacillus sp. FSL R7-0345]|uniref:PT domain-containing protein n=1 Tax=Paenibacillus sp. FSL R7-0345 TaxID=2954535 RepID=UPI00315B0B10
MGILKAVQGVAVFFIVGIIAISCSNQETLPGDAQVNNAASDGNMVEPAIEPVAGPMVERMAEPTVAPTVAPTIEPTVAPTPGQRQEPWEDYLHSVVERREEYLFFAEQKFEINLQEQVEQGDITLVGDESKYFFSTGSYRSAYFIDFDKDGVDELYVITCEGSIRQYYGHIYKRDGEVYSWIDTFEGGIMPYEYNNEIHFLDIIADFETKFTNAVIEYEAEGLTFKPVKTLEVNYTYEVSALPEPWSNVISSAELDTLNEYEILKSPDATVTKLTEQPAYDVQVTDEKNNNTFKFTVQLWLTTVGYAPNYWEIIAADEDTRQFKGMDQINSRKAGGKDNEINYGLKFYKDAASGQMFLLKISSPFFTIGVRKEGDLILELFRFNENDVEQIEEVLLEPEVEIIE